MLAESRNVGVELKRASPFGETGRAVARKEEQVAERGMGVGVIWRHDKHEIVIKPCRRRFAVFVDVDEDNEMG